MGYLIMYIYTCSLESLKGGGEGSPSWPYVEKTLVVMVLGTVTHAHTICCYVHVVYIQYNIDSDE